ncbi:MAG: LacI family DNA-binding transcriptional regulator [Bryobacteraceae bacterium]
MAATIRDVARRANVAVGTVSRVVNNHPDVNTDLRARVLRAAQELDYRPNARARSFARNSSAVLSFILSNRDFLHPFHAHVLQGVQEYCEEAGYFVMYTRFRYSPTAKPAQITLPTVLQSHGMADCVVLAGVNYDNFIGVLEKRGLHYVMLANNFITRRRQELVDQVRFDDYRGATEATEHLIQLGHRNIWYVGDTSLPWYRNRYEGFLLAMNQAGLQPMAQTISLSDDRFVNGLKSVQMLLERHEPVTAIFAGTDDVAYGAWEAIRNGGLQVPRDISLIGFDDQPGMLRHPALTSVRVDTEEIGRQLAKMAISKISMKGQAVPEVLVPTKLMKRETCGPLLTAT